jgi:hypothetical protein
MVKELPCAKEIIVGTADMEGDQADQSDHAASPTLRFSMCLVKLEKQANNQEKLKLLYFHGSSRQKRGENESLQD